MDSDHFVPVWAVACMEDIKALTTDMDLILDVLRGQTQSESDLIIAVNEMLQNLWRENAAIKISFRLSAPLLIPVRCSFSHGAS